MINVIVVFPKAEEAKGIRSLLTRNGVNVIAAVTTGAQAITFFGDMDEALVICGYKFSDMMYTELLEYLPDTFEMLVVAPRNHYAECDRSNTRFDHKKASWFETCNNSCKKALGYCKTIIPQRKNQCQSERVVIHMN